MVILLGDFNAAVGKDTTSGCIGDCQPVGEPKTASQNGESLLMVASMNDLKVANTFFQHRSVHQFTHISNRASTRSRRRKVRVKRLHSVKDYILISAKFMSSVRDCRVYRSIPWDSDHLLLGMRMRLSLHAQLEQRPAQREYDTKLLEVPERSKEFCLQLQNRFDLLDEAQQSSQHEYTAFVESITETAKECLKPAAGGRRRTQYVISQRTMQLQEARRRAHARWMQSQTAAAKALRNQISRQADRAAQLDLQRHIDRQGIQARLLAQQRNMRGLSRAAKSMAGQLGAQPAPKAMRDASGKLQCGPSGVLAVLTAHFTDLLGGASELSSEVCNQLEADVFLFEQQHADTGDENDKWGECPTLAEVATCVKAMRTHAAPGEDLIDARVLKAGYVVLAWLHRIISAVWSSGKAPTEWKSAIIVALYKNKGAKDQPGNYRGISLLSIAGKVYATLIAKRVYAQTNEQLHEAQCGFRGGRGTIDAIFALRSLSQACSEKKKCMARAYIDFTKAYDCVNRQALWKVLRLYGVHSKLIALLDDLHSGTDAAVRMDGKLGSRFRVSSGVRQGCVIAPSLFNIFIDLVIKKALSRMPENCGIKIKSRSDDQSVLEGSFEYIVMLMYADDVVLMSHDPEELAYMLKAIDEVACEFGMKINASKTEIQIQDCDKELPLFNVSTGPVNIVDEFKYLGSWQQNGGSMDKEISVRRGRVFGVFL